jgi:hypothetical protein
LRNGEILESEERKEAIKYLDEAHRHKDEYIDKTVRNLPE